MLSINEQLCAAAAKQLMILLESNYLTTHEEVPLGDDDLLRFSKLTLNQQRFIIAHSSHFVSVELDVESLRRKLDDIEQEAALHALEETYLLRGAPLALMRRLFGMHASEFSRRRQLLSMGGSATGRPRDCDEETEHGVWHHWQANKPLDERERFLAVAEATQADLHVVWHALRHYIDQPD
jgi:hypothetical protein